MVDKKLLSEFHQMFATTVDELKMMLASGKWGQMARVDSAKKEVILEALKETNQAVRRAAVSALGFITYEPDVQLALMALLTDHDDMVRAKAFEVLNQEKNLVRQNSQAFFSGLTDENALVRENAVRLMSYVVHQKEVEKKLKQMVLTESEDQAVRAAALSSLRPLMTKSSIQKLAKQFLDDESSSLRESAHECFSSISCQPKVYKKYIKLLKSLDEEIRKNAVEVLEPAANIEVVRQALLATVSDPDEFVQDSAVRSLEAWSHLEEVKEVLLKAVLQKHPEERTTFLISLRKGLADQKVQQVFYDTVVATNDYEVIETAILQMRERSSELLIQKTLLYVLEFGSGKLYELAKESMNYQEKLPKEDHLS